LICDPPAQSGTQMATELGMSKGSVSAGRRDVLFTRRDLKV
jgi:hypothetical protein